MMTGVETGAAPDLLMECDEDDQEVWTPSSETDREERRHGGETERRASVDPLPVEHDALRVDLHAVSLKDQKLDAPPFRIIPIPVQPVRSCSPPTADPVKSAGAPLGFTVNGQLVPLQPGGGGTELKLRSHPGGSASGFTSVQIPVTLTLHSPAGTHCISTTASLTASVASSPSLPAPPAAPTAPDPVPIITGVVSGEAAQKVLSDHNVNFKSSSPQKPLPSAVDSPLTSPRAKRRTGSKPVARNLLRKGELGPVCPPDCLVCLSQYKLVPELRGFLCLCSSDIAQSLRNLKKKSRHYRPSRDKNRTPNSCSKVSKTRPALSPKTHRQPDDVLLDQFTCPTSPSAASHTLMQLDQSGSAPDASHGKLVILVEDFYYGSAPGEDPPRPDTGKSKSCHCIHCPKTLRTNLKLMSHMQQHVATMTDSGEMENVCPHCFRHFTSPFKLQCHMEAVHSQYESTVTCRICELAFGSEPAFLLHMKTTHKPGEMPYICQVCGFRSSFYSDVWRHFHIAHGSTRNLLCQYCLRVMRNSTCFQQHFARHQKKHVFSCNKCRLHFLYVKERIDHAALHRTHVKPVQLCGLKPGTKVTVRTYSVVRGSEDEGLKKTATPCKVVDVAPPAPSLEPPKRKPVESLGSLLCGVMVDRPHQRCVECLNPVLDFKVHFPSLVHCSLCRFLTCCSTSYANHMINNHAACRKNPPYQTIFQPAPKLSQTLSCGVCSFSTCRGDMMADHLMETPDHTCIVSRAESSLPPPAGVGGFIPIHLVPSHQTSTQLSVKPLTCPTILSSPSAMVIKFLGPRPQPAQPAVPSLSVPQLTVVLSSLCHGVPQASCRHNTSPMTIRSWIEQQAQGLSNRKWHWKTDKMAEWVLGQREQHLTVGEDVLLMTARGALGKNCQLADCYSWTVDFLLRHDLGLQSNSNSKLPKSVQQNIQSFIKAFNLQVQSHALPPQALGCMDEFPVFINHHRFSKQSLLALQLRSSPEDRPVFDVVLSALADGRFLPPLLFFSGAAAGVPEGFPDNVLLEARQEGFSDEERLHIWMEKVWRPHVASQHNKSFLMVDVHRRHLTEEFRDTLSSVSTEAVFIPSGCCCRLQPLEVCVIPVLRDFLQARWFMLVNGGLDGLGLDQMALTLACWLSEVTSTLNSERHFMSRSFSSVSNLQHVNDHSEATKMINALTVALTQPVELGQPEPRAEAEQLELLLVMEQRKEEEEEKPEDGAEEQVEEELSVESPSALRRVFDGDSDQDSFHGFQDG